MHQYSPSLNLDNIFGSELTQNYEKFSLFMKAYYEWLQTTKITLSEISGTFVQDEFVVGSVTGARAKIKAIGTGYIVVDRTTETVFNNYETITGLTSEATGRIIAVKDNIVKSSGIINDYKTIEKSIDKYVDYLKNEIYPSVPKEVYGNKREIAKRYREFFESKGTQQSFEFFFRLIYDEEINLYYPGEDILRVSDGNFEKTQILRTTVPADIFDFLNKTIRGVDSEAIGNVIDIKTFFLGSIEIAEMTLALVSGTFSAGELIQSVDDVELQATTFGLITGFNIVDAGSGYSVGDQIVITGDGSEATAVVSSIRQSPITKLKINSTGYGYRLGTQATINNTGTGGSGLVVKVTELANTFVVSDGGTDYTVGEISTVKIISRGDNYFKAPTITLEDATISGIGFLSEDLITIISGGTNYTVGDWLEITGGDGSGANGIVASVEESVTYDFLFEDDARMILETGKDILKNEDWNVTGPIIRVELTDVGSGYTDEGLPSINVVSGTGSSAILTANGILGNSANVSVDVSNNATGIGSIRAIEITNFGVNYSTATANATTIGDGNANLIPIITGLGIKDGNWINDDGKIDYKIIQDSFYYQDFSYVIRSGLVFNSYKDLLKKIIHPAGLQAFGEIIVTSFAQVRMRVVTAIDVLRDIEQVIIQITSAFDASISASIQIEVSKLIIALINASVSSDVPTERLVIRETKSESSADLLNREYILYTTPATPNVSITPEVLTTVEMDIDANFGADVLDVLAPGALFYFELPISTLENRVLGSYVDITFLDTYTVARATVQTKATGTVSVNSGDDYVIGIGTDFTLDYSVNDYITISGEKFIVKNVANSEYLELNVPAVSTYTNEFAYKESVV